MIIEEQKKPIKIEHEMKTSFLDYAMSVIVGRALPDAKDGLKPVHRRLLYGMNDMGLTYNKPFRKCAKIVGEVMGNYHPHGDAAVYDTLVRMAQHFSLRYTLVDGQGNFGSIDGDPPAAMRYTEAKLARISEEMLRDLDKDTVDFVLNYDESTTEPVVLPAAVPQLLINGASGIAVGMATNIPPHNLTETINAVIHLIDHPDAGIRELMKHIHGPDFPTAGIINGRSGILKAYETGRGRVVMRARAEIVHDEKSKKEKIIITELPYQVNKAALIEKIANLVKNKKITGIADLLDESDRVGLQISIDVKKGENAQVILNQLYTMTPLQNTFGINMVALVDGKPEILNLRQALNEFIKHRKTVVYRRTAFELDKAEKRAHILEGLLKALDNIDEIIELIRSSQTAAEAKESLMERFEFSDAQAQAVLDMRLQRLIGLERQKIQEEYTGLLKEIERLRAILDSEALLVNVIRNELKEVIEKFGDERRTEIRDAESDFDIEDLITEESMVVMVTHHNYIKRSSLSLYRSQKRRGMGITGIIAKEGDFVEHLFVGSTHDHILFFTDKGTVYARKIFELPQAGRTSKGNSIANILNLSSEEKIAAILPVKEFDENSYLIFATEKGIVKKTELSQYATLQNRNYGIIALNIREEDRLISVKLTDGSQEVFLATKRGMAIRFRETDVRATGRNSSGVIGIRLSKNDSVVSMVIVGKDYSILVISENGYGKRTHIDEYRLQSRGGKGIINIRLTGKIGNVVDCLQVKEEDQILMITQTGKMIRIGIDESSLRMIGRSTQGVKLQNIGDDGKVVAVAKCIREEDELI